MAGFQTAAAGRIRLNTRPATPVVDITLCRPWLAVNATVSAPEPVKQAWHPPMAKERGEGAKTLELRREREGGPVLDLIIRTVCLVTDVRRMDLVSARRDPVSVKARQIVCYLAKHHTVLSFPQIARGIGKGDHTTAIWAVRRVQSCLDHYGLPLPSDIGAAADMLWRLEWPSPKLLNRRH